MNRRQRGALADATLAAGATILLLFSTTGARFGWLALAGGIALVVLGGALLWGTPRPPLRTRMLSSIAGLLLGFGMASVGVGAGAAFSIGAGALLLLGVLVMNAR